MIKVEVGSLKAQVYGSYEYPVASRSRSMRESLLGQPSISWRLLLSTFASIDRCQMRPPLAPV